MNLLNIYLPVTPSTRISSEEIVTDIFTVSYGGGMGGSSETIYARKTVDSKNIVILTLLSGEEIELTKTYIVKKRTARLVKVVTDTRLHRENNKFKKHHTIQYFSLNYCQNYKTHNCYGSVQQNFKTEIETEEY